MALPNLRRLAVGTPRLPGDLVYLIPCSHAEPGRPRQALRIYDQLCKHHRDELPRLVALVEDNDTWVVHKPCQHALLCIVRAYGWDRPDSRLRTLIRERKWWLEPTGDERHFRKFSDHKQLAIRAVAGKVDIAALPPLALRFFAELNAALHVDDETIIERDDYMDYPMTVLYDNLGVDNLVPPSDLPLSDPVYITVASGTGSKARVAVPLSTLDLSELENAHADADEHLWVSKLSDNRSFNSSVERWNPVSMVNADNLFGGCYAFTGSGLEKWELPSLVSAANMFARCNNLNFSSPIGIDGQTWRLPKLEDAYAMFADCVLLNPSSVASWNPTMLREAKAMFVNCRAFTGSGLENWELAELVDATYMFHGCTSLNFSHCSESGGRTWRLQKLEVAAGMFERCVLFNPSSVASWNPQMLQSASEMFRGCTAFTGSGLEKWELPNLVDASDMFNGCTSLDLRNLRGWKLPNVPYDELKGMLQDVPVFDDNPLVFAQRLEVLMKMISAKKMWGRMYDFIRHVFGEVHGQELLNNAFAHEQLRLAAHLEETEDDWNSRLLRLGH